MPEAAIHEGGAIKYMWDGEDYASADDAKAKADEYRKEGFEVKEIREADKTYLYTRREVTEIVLDGAPPV